MSQLQILSSKYCTMKDKYLSSVVQVVEGGILAASKGLIDWSLIEGFYPGIFHIVKTLKNDLFSQKKVC